jgi:broad specificity phosphatase PhoE
MSRFRGSIDVPLTRQGYHDALDVGFRLPTVDVLIHDWQQRTRETARCIQIAHPLARMEQQHVTSQRLGWLEGETINNATLMCMRYYIDNPSEVPSPGEAQCFGEWLREWFILLDQIRDEAENKKKHYVIVTHNRNLQAVRSREGMSIDKSKFDDPGPAPCEILFISRYLSAIRHAETDWGT